MVFLIFHVPCFAGLRLVSILVLCASAYITTAAPVTLDLFVGTNTYVNVALYGVFYFCCCCNYMRWSLRLISGLSILLALGLNTCVYL